jgi:hypothetical protein
MKEEEDNFKWGSDDEDEKPPPKTNAAPGKFTIICNVKNLF